MKDKNIEELLNEIKVAIVNKDQAEKARVQAEFKKKKAQYNYLNLIDTLRAKEYTI